MIARIALSLPLLLLLGCKPIPGSGNSKTEKRDIGEFTTIVAATGVEVDIEAGARTPVEVTADDNLLEKVKTEASGGKLRVSIDGNVEAKTPIVVHVAAPGIKEYDAESGAKLNATGVDGDSVTMVSKSGAKLTATGAANKVSLEASSGAHLDASGVKADTVDAKVSSGADASAQAAKAVSGSASSGAHLHVTGGPAKKDVGESSGGAVSYE
jgi:hypothetical protein